MDMASDYSLPATIATMLTPELHADILRFMKAHRWAVEATATPGARPQAALVGFAVTPQLEVVFDTLTTTRKAANLRENPRVALVIGGWTDGELRSLQYEGVADFPEGAELERLQADYFDAFPDGPDRLSWPGITYVRISPTWMRLSDFSRVPPTIVEVTMANH